MNDAHFLRAVLADPEDDVTRLAYADWLLEQPDEERVARGEFIQAQIALARRAPLDPDRADALRARERELLAQYGEAWERQAVPARAGYQFHRGFVEVVVMDCPMLMRPNRKLFANAPVRRLKLTTGLTEASAASPNLGRFRELDLSRTHLMDAGVRRLATSPHAAQLRWLDLSWCSLTGAALTALTKAKFLGRLEHLDLSMNGLRISEKAEALLASPPWQSLRSLTLSSHCFQPRQPPALRDTPTPALLAAQLRLCARRHEEKETAEVREFTRRAAAGDAAEVLAEGLGDTRRMVRAAAASMLGGMGAAGAQALPALVRRLYDREPRVRDAAAPALASLLGELSEPMRRWLCVLATPLGPASANLRAALESAELPAAVRAAFAAACAQRAAWWAKVGGREVAGGDGVEKALRAAADHAARHTEGEQAQRKRAAAEADEAAWLLARLTALLLDSR